MTATAKNVLESFDELPEPEQREVACAILRRTLRFELPSLTDEDLPAQADELFLALVPGVRAAGRRNRFRRHRLGRGE